ncbi:MAG: histidine kinase [Lachnospiraceae bacterium]|nr:histidine kinase [Lachnospiraceae bacterium]
MGSSNDFIYASIEIWGALLCFIAIVISVITRKANPRGRAAMMLLQFVSALLMLSDVAAWTLGGQPGQTNHILLHIAYFADFTFIYIDSVLFVWYLSEFSKPDDTGRFIGWGIRSLSIFAVIFTIVSSFNGMYYYIDADNIYHRGPLFTVSQTIGGVIMFCQILLILHGRKGMRPRLFWGILAYTVFPVIALGIQFCVYSPISRLNVGLAVSLLLMQLVSTLDQTHEIIEQREEIVRQKEDIVLQQKAINEMQVQVVISQIQPHFLYNSLNAIYYLCEKDPEKAQKAISQFSDYLRGNMDSLKSRDLIPFAKELHHVECYLSLEKMRFEEELNIEYDIQETGFMIPALGLQPVVENAVKHGVGKQMNGGTVRIASRREGDSCIVTVEDNGVGFDPSEGKQDERSHIGLENVRSRIEQMTGGTVQIESHIGEGTRVTLKIPSVGGNRGE